MSCGRCGTSASRWIFWRSERSIALGAPGLGERGRHGRTTVHERLLDIDGGLLLALDAHLKERNVTHAAARPGITQPTLSARLTRLRQLFGDPLLLPAASGRGMVPTPHACALQPELTRLIDRMREFAILAQVFDPATSERVFRIAATDNPAASLAPELVPAIRARAPRIRLAFVVPDKARIAIHIEQGDADLLIGAAEDMAGGSSAGRCSTKSSSPRSASATAGVVPVRRACRSCGTVPARVDPPERASRRPGASAPALRSRRQQVTRSAWPKPLA